MANRDKIRTPGIAADLDGAFTTGIKKPSSISSKRVKIRYDDDGGTDMDGVIQIRRGVGTSLGNSSYAQVRIAVDGNPLPQRHGRCTVTTCRKAWTSSSIRIRRRAPRSSAPRITPSSNR